MRILSFILIIFVNAYGETDEFFVVSGSFGDAWKDKVLTGEYRTVPGKTINGRIYMQKRNGDDFYISYNAEDKTWYWQTKQYLNTRVNFAHIKCTRATQTPSECYKSALERCQVWTSESRWVACKEIQIVRGDQKLRNKHRREQEMKQKFAALKNHPRYIFVDAVFGDDWKDSELFGLFKLKPFSGNHLGGRPVYQKADDTNIYLTYYEPTHEWAFRTEEAIGSWLNYAYFSPSVETQNPIQITQTTYECHVFAKQSSGNYEWQECTKPNGQYDVKITARDGYNTDVNIMIETEKIPSSEQLRNYDQAEDSDVMEIIIRQQPKYQYVALPSKFINAKYFCKDNNAKLSYFTGREEELSQKWIISYQPWVNVRKMNGRWINSDGEEIFNVKIYDQSHECARYFSNQIVSENCDAEHMMVCERLD